MNLNHRRIQITCQGRLIAEAILESSRECDILWSHYTLAKAKRSLDLGGCIIQRADLPRYWNVKVGELLKVNND